MSTEQEQYAVGKYIFNSEFRKGDTAFIREEMIERKIMAVDFGKDKLKLKGIRKWIDMKDIKIIARPY